MPLANLAQFAEMDINSIIRETKSKICAICTKTLTAPFANSPCGCSFCSKECYNEYIDIVIKSKKKEKRIIYLI
jgi:hypothetical protein